MYGGDHSFLQGGVVKIEILNRGSVVETKEFGEGTYKIGRTDESDIALKSPQISKQHALLVIKGNRAAIVDLGSSNGIFINGIMIKKHRLEPNDEVAIADFKIRLACEVRSSGAKSNFSAASTAGNLAQNIEVRQAENAPPPLSPQERLLRIMDEKVLAPFYSLLKTLDWRTLLSLILGGSLVLSVLLSVHPVIRWGKEITTKESLARAHAVLAQVVRENYRIVNSADSDVSRLTIEACEAESGILSCVILDPKTNSILAPAKLFNKSLTDVYSLIAIKKTLEDRNAVSVEKENGIYIVAQPISIFSKEENDRVVSAVVVAEFKTPEGVYSTAEPLVWAILIGILLSLISYYLIFKMMTRPLIVMQEQLDAALKGDPVSVTCESKFAELETLATVINFSISRWRRMAGQGEPITAENPEVEEAEYIKTVQEFDQGATDGLLLLDKDKKIRHVGKILEEILGIRNQYAIGQNISDACRDPAFAGTVIDLSDRVLQAFGEAQFSQLEINGIPKQIVAIGHKDRAGEVKAILLMVKANG